MRVQTRSLQKGDVMGQAWLPSHHMQNQHTKFSAEGGVKVGGGVAFRWGWWTEMSQPLLFFFPGFAADSFCDLGDVFKSFFSSCICAVCLDCAF